MQPQRIERRLLGNQKLERGLQGPQEREQGLQGPPAERGAIGIALLVWLFGGGLGLAALVFLLLKIF